MKLLVARHGECVTNMLGIVAGGRDDSPLTPHGMHEAQILADSINGFNGLIVSSPLIRAYETALQVRDRILPGVDIRVDPNFTEIDVGDAMGMQLADYFTLEKSGAPIRDAETPAEIFKRVERGITILKKSDTDTLLVTHSGTYRMIVCVLQDLLPQAFVTVPGLQNCEAKTFEL